ILENLFTPLYVSLLPYQKGQQDDKGEALCCELGCPTIAIFIHCDVSDESNVYKVVDATIATYGKLDVMFNNVEIVGQRCAKKKDFERVVPFNLSGAFLVTKQVACIMVLVGWGSIIIITSVCWVIGGWHRTHSPARSMPWWGCVGRLTNSCWIVLRGKLRIKLLKECKDKDQWICDVVMPAPWHPLHQRLPKVVEGDGHLHPQACLALPLCSSTEPYAAHHSGQARNYTGEGRPGTKLKATLEEGGRGLGSIQHQRRNGG
ncbi:hypothetical protein Taro_010890, partial [Colocasia esculenta]|nr:hypothetical protein [Colocasia esculenta]